MPATKVSHLNSKTLAVTPLKMKLIKKIPTERCAGKDQLAKDMTNVYIDLYHAIRIGNRL